MSLGLRYDLEVLPIPETDDPLVTTYPTDRNNFAPRLGATYTLDKQGVVRAGYGRFFDKTHFEVVGGLYTGTPFTNSFNSTFPVAGPISGRATGVPDGSVPGERAGHQPRPARPDVPARFGDPQHVRDLGQPGSAHAVIR